MVVDNLIFNIRRTGDAGTSSMNRLSTSIKKLGNTAKSSTSKLSTFISSLKRIAFYRFLRTIIKEISEAFTEGLENVYQYSKTISSSISEALDSISSAGFQMKNQLGAALGELIVTIQPVIEAVISLITKLADALSQVFALLGGRTVYHKATESTQEWAESANNAASAAKEWKNQLMGFDEINRLEESTSSSGGSGSDNDYGNWELSPVTIDLSFLDKYKTSIQEWISSLDFEPLSNAWETLKTRIKEFAELVDTALFWALENVLEPLGTWIIEDAAPASVELLASMLNFLNAVLEKIGPVLAKLWDEWLKPIASFIGDIFVQAVQSLADTFNSLAEKIRNADSLSEFLKSLDGKETLILGIVTAIGLLIGKFLLFSTISTIISAFGTVFAAIFSPAGLIAIAIALVIALIIDLYQNWETYSEQAKELLDKVAQFIDEKVDAIKTFFSNLLTYLQNTFSSAWSSVWDTVTSVFDTVSSTISRIADGIKSVIESIISVAKSAIEWLDKLSVKRAEERIQAAEEDGSIYLGSYATGGFPEDGLFMANSGELVGQFSNGKTAVANNEEIISGISRGVYEAMVAAGSSGNSESRGTKTAVFNVNGREFLRAIWDDRNAVISEHGVSLITNG